MSLATRRRSDGTVTPPPHIKQATSYVVCELGLAPAARQLGLHKHIVAAVAAGAPVRRGSIALIETALREHAAGYLAAAQEASR